MHEINEKTGVILIEPPCGRNCAIILSEGKCLFVDTGYAYCADEMKKLFSKLIPEFENMKKEVFITHADVDHCGLLPYFDTVYASEESAKCLKMEYETGGGFREKNPLHKPYIQICKILTSYKPVDSKKIKTVGKSGSGKEVLERTGFFDFGNLHFELYQGMGGHLFGESVFIDYENCVVFSGDIFVNIKDMTEKQAEYNRYAPILMTSVDTDPKLCAQERKALFSRLGAGEWKIFCGHGAMKKYVLKPEE